MLYDLVEFADGVRAIREINAAGQVTRYCNEDGTDIGRLHQQVNIVGPAAPAWALPPEPTQPDPTPAPPASRRLSKLAFVSRLGTDFATILMAAKQDVGVEMFVRMLDWATPDADGTSVDLDDPRVIYGLQSLEAAGLLAAGRASEILHA